MTVSKASLSKVQYTTPIADVPDPAIISEVSNVGTSRAFDNAAATISYTAALTGGTPVSFTATSIPESLTGTGASPITVEGLDSNTAYTFKMSSTNASGTSVLGSASSSVTVTSVPTAPTIGTPTVTSSTVVSVPFTPAATGGSAITSYVITSTPSVAVTTQAGTTSPLTATATYIGGTEYTFTIAAVNANGTSAESSASTGVTPLAQFNANVHYLVLAGGGGSSNFYGAGAGGYRTSYQTSGAQSSAESVKAITSGTNYTVTVGAGGSTSTNGSNSVFSTITSIGGGRGSGDAELAAGGSGGANNGLGTALQGRNGGAHGHSQGLSGLGGGGGASTNGAEGHGQQPNGVGGARGAGLSCSITGTSILRAEGGHGGADVPNHSNSAGCSGAANKGAGGASSAGTSGVVILRYPTATPLASIGGGLTSTTTADGSDDVTVFTAGTGNVAW